MNETLTHMNKKPLVPIGTAFLIISGSFFTAFSQGAPGANESWKKWVQFSALSRGAKSFHLFEVRQGFVRKPRPHFPEQLSPLTRRPELIGTVGQVKNRGDLQHGKIANRDPRKGEGSARAFEFALLAVMGHLP